MTSQIENTQSYFFVGVIKGVNRITWWFTPLFSERDSVYAECLNLLEQRGYIHNDIKEHNDIQVDNN